MAHDPDDALLDAAADQAGELPDLPPSELAPRLHSLVQAALAARRRDGTWPPPELVQEVLRLYLAALDELVPPGDRPALGLGDDQPWVTAWRSCATSLPALEPTLHALHATEDTAGIPSYPSRTDFPFFTEG